MDRAPADYSRYGTREAEIIAIEVLDDNGRRRNVFNYGENFHLRFRVKSSADIDRFVLGNIFRNRYGFNVYGTNGDWLGLPPGSLKKGQECLVTFHHRANLAAGSYSINPAVSAVTGRRTYRTLDWINNAAVIEIQNSIPMEGYVSIPTRIDMEIADSGSENIPQKMPGEPEYRETDRGRG